MQRIKFVIGAALVFAAACGSDQARLTLNEPAFDKGVANPGTVLGLRASYATSVPTYYYDGRAVPGAPDVLRLFSKSLQVPQVVGHEIDCPLYTLGPYGSYPTDWYLYCLYGIDLPMTFAAVCGDHSGGPGTTPSQGVLTARMTTSLSTATFSYVVVHFREVPGPHPDQTEEVSPPIEHASLSLPAADADRLVTILRNRYSLPYGVAQGRWFLARDKSTPDIPVSVSLPQDLGYIATHIGTGDALSSPNPADLLALLGSQSLVDLARIMSPVFNPVVHANNAACRGPDKITPVEIPFTETVNFVSTPSGNQNLIFASGLNEPALHYNAQQGRTSGSGTLLSNDGLSFLDLSQFTGSSLPVINNLMTGAGVPARTCLIANPGLCTDVTLQRK